MDDADDLRKQLEEEVKRSEALKDKLADEQMAQIAGLQVQELKLTKEQEDYAGSLLAKVTTSPLTPKEMARIAEDLNVDMSEDQATKVFSTFDMDKDGVLNTHEFALWWLQCYRPASVLLRAAMTNKYEKLKAAPAKPEWTPGVRINYSFTTGTVDDDFNAKSSVYVSALPANADVFKKSLQQHVADVKGDDDEELSTEKAVGVAAVLAPIAADASEEAVAECVELFRAVAEEYSAMEESPVVASAGIVTEQGKRYLKLVSVIRNSGEVEAIQKFESFMSSGQSKKALFDKLLVGLEFGTNANDVFNPTSTQPIASMLDQARGTVIARGSDNIADIVEAAAMHKVRDHNLSRGYIFEKLLPPSIMSRGLRQLNGMTAFDSPRHLLEAALEELVQSPLRRAVERGASRDEILLVRDECETLRTKVKAIIQRFCPWEITCKELLGFKKLDKFLGAPTEQVRIAIVGPKNSGKSWLMHCLQFPDAAQLTEVPAQVVNPPPCNGAALVVSEKPVVMFDVRSDSLNVVPGMRCHAVVVAIDASAEDPKADMFHFLKQAAIVGIKSDKITVVLTHMDKAKNDPTDKIKEVAEGCKVFTSKLCCANPSVPTDMLKSLVESAEIDASAAETGEEVAQTLALAFRNVSNGIEHIFFTSELVDAHVSLDNMPLFGFFPGTKEGLSAMRGQSRAQLRGTRQSVKTMESGSFEACRKEMSFQHTEDYGENSSCCSEDD